MTEAERDLLLKLAAIVAGDIRGTINIMDDASSNRVATEVRQSIFDLMAKIRGGRS